jgi:isopenicillin N synthase-like dioxygenase
MSSSQVRLLKYSANSEDCNSSKSAGGSGEADRFQGPAERIGRGLLTLVVQPSAEMAAVGAAAAVGGGGLEVFDQRSEERVKPPLGAVVVMVGRTLEKASAGVFRSTFPPCYQWH